MTCSPPAVARWPAFAGWVALVLAGLIAADLVLLHLRGSDVYRRAFNLGLLVRVTGDTIALSPPLIISETEIDEAIEKLSKAIAESSNELI